MKRLAKVFVATLLSCMVSSNVMAAINDGLIAYYPFDGDAHDNSGNGNDGVMYGGITFAEGVNGQAAIFDGIPGTKITTPVELKGTLENQYLTVSLWGYSDSGNDGPLYYTAPFICNHNIGDPAKSVMITPYKAGIISEYTGTTWRIPYKDISPYTSIFNWHHYVLTYDNQYLNIYIDGELVISDNIGSDMVGGIGSYDRDDSYYNRFLTFGTYNNSFNYTEEYFLWFKGRIDDVRIYNRALHEAEVTELYQTVVEQNIIIEPLDYDFGEVEPGSPSTMYLNITNTGGTSLIVDDIYFQYDILGEPFTAEMPSLPLEIAANTSTDISVSYNPSILFYTQNNVLGVVSNDPDEPVIEVAFTGTGVLFADEPSEIIQSIKLYIDFAVEHELLVFTGDGESGAAHYDALNTMLDSASSANNSCGPLQSIYKKLDGDPKQPDWIEGPATESIAIAIQDLMDEAGCK